jgi:hypothetical protein
MDVELTGQEQESLEVPPELLSGKSNAINPSPISKMSTDWATFEPWPKRRDLTPVGYSVMRAASSYRGI